MLDQKEQADEAYTYLFNNIPGVLPTYSGYKIGREAALTKDGPRVMDFFSRVIEVDYSTEYGDPSTRYLFQLNPGLTESILGQMIEQNPESLHLKAMLALGYATAHDARATLAYRGFIDQCRIVSCDPALQAAARNWVVCVYAQAGCTLERSEYEWAIE